MAIKNAITCDECKDELSEDDLVYCESCYSKLGGGLAGCAQRVYELENKITELKQALFIARREG